MKLRTGCEEQEMVADCEEVGMAVDGGGGGEWIAMIGLD